MFSDTLCQINITSATLWNFHKIWLTFVWVIRKQKVLFFSEQNIVKYKLHLATVQAYERIFKGVNVTSLIHNDKM